ncbi:MAG: hypothetical protein JWQ21_1908 [Herminiimonas sp.]|nr:hypothetical protein [Herminiimonas sp.]
MSVLIDVDPLSVKSCGVEHQHTENGDPFAASICPPGAIHQSFLRIVLLQTIAFGKIT